MPNVTIIDNFLEHHCFQQIFELSMSEDMPWYFQTQVTYGDEIPEMAVKPRDPQNFFLTHQLIRLGSRMSHVCDVFQPLFNALDASIIIRAQASLFTPTEKPYALGFHQDTVFRMKTGVYYVNSNNGYTMFSDGSVVESVANRICIFDAFESHTTVTATDVSARIIINTVFLDFEDAHAEAPTRLGGFYI